MEIKRDQAFISGPNSGPAFFFTHFFVYVELKDILVIDIVASEDRKYV